VVSLHPAIVHIVAGSVDLATASAASQVFVPARFAANIVTMVGEAKAANIKVILGPVTGYLPVDTAASHAVWPSRSSGLVGVITAGGWQTGARSSAETGAGGELEQIQFLLGHASIAECRLRNTPMAIGKDGQVMAWNLARKIGSLFSDSSVVQVTYKCGRREKQQAISQAEADYRKLYASGHDCLMCDPNELAKQKGPTATEVFVEYKCGHSMNVTLAPHEDAEWKVNSGRVLMCRDCLVQMQKEAQER
jgi:hypothetical protein